MAIFMLIGIPEEMPPKNSAMVVGAGFDLPPFIDIKSVIVFGNRIN